MLYGLESAHINDSVIKKLEVFQLKALRKVLRLKTTYIDRSNTNSSIYETANRKLSEITNKKIKAKPIVTFREAYRASKIKRLVRILNNQGGLADKLTFQDGLETWKYPGTRQGRPKNTWANQALKEVWERVKIDSEFGHREFKGDDKDIEREIREWAGKGKM